MLRLDLLTEPSPIDELQSHRFSSAQVAIKEEEDHDSKDADDKSLSAINKEMDEMASRLLVGIK